MRLKKGQREAIEALARGGKSLAVNLPAVAKGRKPPRPLPHYCVLAPGPAGRWEVAIPEYQPTRLNQLMHAHYAKAATLKWEDAQVIGQALRAAGVSRAEGKRRVQLVVILGPRQRGGDPDSFFKATLDALTRSGALVDDNRQGVELMPTEYARGPVKGCVIRLEDL